MQGEAQAIFIGTNEKYFFLKISWNQKHRVWLRRKEKALFRHVFFVSVGQIYIGEGYLKLF